MPQEFYLLTPWPPVNPHAIDFESRHLMDAIEKTTAPLFLGILLNYALYGVLSLQLYVYYVNFRVKDRRPLQILVYSIYILDTIQTGLTTWDGLHWFVYGWGKASNLQEPVASSIDSPFLGGIIALAVQAFFCWRIYQLGRSKILSGVIFAVSLIAMGGGMAAGITSVILNDLTRVQKEDFIQTYIWLAGSVAADTLIAGATLYLLHRSRKNSIPETNMIITRVIQLTVQTNCLTAAVAIVTFTLFIAFPNQNYFMCPPFFFAKLYSNTLLAILNHRLLTRNSLMSPPMIVLGTKIDDDLETLSGLPSPGPRRPASAIVFNRANHSIDTGMLSPALSPASNNVRFSALPDFK